MATFTYDDISLEQDLPAVFKALKDYCHKPENPFCINSDFIDQRGFSLDLTRTSSFVSGDFRCKIHLSGYSSDDPSVPGCKLNFSISTSDDDEARIKEGVLDRLMLGLNRQLEGKTEAQMLAEAQASGTANMKDLIGEGKEKRNFIIAILIVAVAVAIMLPSGISQGCLL